MRAGMRPPDDDPLPWLAEPDEIEVQEVAQKMEEPLRRLVEQLFWFDFETDPAGVLLSRALRGDVEALSDALAIPEPKAPARGKTPQDEAASMPEPFDKERIATLTARINQANLRLLSALAAMHGIGPRLPAKSQAGGVKAASLPEKQFTDVDGLQILVNAHELAATQDTRERAHERLLRKALSCWAAILADADFPAFLQHLIARLGDDLVKGEDAETLVRAACTVLVDIVTGEIKRCTLAGRMDRTASLVRIAGNCGMDAHVWIQALKPLRHMFRAEIDNLATLIAEPAPASIDNLRLYFKRLDALRNRWRALDSSDLLGLAEIIDEGVLRAHERIHAIQATLTVRNDLAESENLHELFVIARRVACSNSLKEMLRTAAERIERAREQACHFCGEREASDFPTVLEAKKETEREHDWLGRTERIHYIIHRAIVPRCERCADFHDYLHFIFWVILAALGAGCTVVLLEVELSLSFKVFMSAIILIILVAYIVRDIAARLLTPRSERRFTDVESSVGWRELLADGYGDISLRGFTIRAGYIAIHSRKNAAAAFRRRSS